MQKTADGMPNGTTAPTGGAPRRRKKQEPITAQDALAMLQSAVSYCQQAGLSVMARNGDNGTLGLFILGAHYVLLDNGTRAEFQLGVMAQHSGTREVMAQVSPFKKRGNDGGTN